MKNELTYINFSVHKWTVWTFTQGHNPLPVHTRPFSVHPCLPPLDGRHKWMIPCDIMFMTKASIIFIFFRRDDACDYAETFYAKSYSFFNFSCSRWCIWLSRQFYASFFVWDIFFHVRKCMWLTFFVKASSFYIISARWLSRQFNSDVKTMVSNCFIFSCIL